MGSGVSKSQNSGIHRNVATIVPTDKESAINPAEIVVDSRLPFARFRELFTLKNYWKTIRRNETHCANLMLFKYLKANPANQLQYEKLKNIEITSEECSEKAFESIALAYLKVFDDVINSLEDSPSDATSACSRLTTVGKMHRTKVPGMKFDDFQQLESPFLHMVQDVLQDRFNEKAENLFRKFFQFCLKYILEGFKT